MRHAQRKLAAYLAGRIDLCTRRCFYPIVIAFVACGNSVSACPTCKDGLSNSSNLISGYGWSIVFMMSMPFLILAGVGGYFYYEICQARKVQRLAVESDRLGDG